MDAPHSMHKTFIDNSYSSQLLYCLPCTFSICCMVALLCTPFLCVFTIQLMVSHVMSSMNPMGIVYFCFGLTCRWCFLCVRHHEVVAVLHVSFWLVPFLFFTESFMHVVLDCLLVHALARSHTLVCSFVCVPSLLASLGVSPRTCFVFMLLEWHFSCFSLLLLLLLLFCTLVQLRQGRLNYVGGGFSENRF